MWKLLEETSWWKVVHNSENWCVGSCRRVLMEQIFFEGCCCYEAMIMKSGVVILLIASADQGSLELSGCFSCSSVLWKNESIDESVECGGGRKSDVQRSRLQNQTPNTQVARVCRQKARVRGQISEKMTTWLRSCCKEVGSIRCVALSLQSI